MGEAFLCDRCDDFHEGRPEKYVAWGPTKTSARSRANEADELNWALCADCVEGFAEFLGIKADE